MAIKNPLIIYSHKLQKATPTRRHNTPTLCTFPHLLLRPTTPHTALNSHLFIWQARHLVDILLLDHEGSQVGSVGGQEDDSEEGPHWHHDLTGGTFGILHGDGVVEDQTPEQPDGLTDGEGGTAGLWERNKRGGRGAKKDDRGKQENLFHRSQVLLHFIYIYSSLSWWMDGGDGDWIYSHSLVCQCSLDVVHGPHPLPWQPAVTDYLCSTYLSGGMTTCSRVETLPTVSSVVSETGRESEEGVDRCTAGYNYATVGAAV